MWSTSTSLGLTSTGARRTTWLNGLAIDDRDFIYGDASTGWIVSPDVRQVFDVVIVDPPSFSSTPFSVTRDYPRLVAAAANVVARGGRLLAVTNHAQTSDARFDAWLREGLLLADRRPASVDRWREPSVDFPIPRSGRHYLKVRALELEGTSSPPTANLLSGGRNYVPASHEAR